MAVNFKEIVAEKAKIEPAVVTPTTAVITRVLLCPDSLEAVASNRADQVSTAETQTAIARLTLLLINLAYSSDQTPLVSTVRTAKALSNKDNGTPHLQEGEVGLWQLKVAGYHILGPENFIAHSIPQHLFFKFKDGKLTDHHQMRAAHQFLMFLKADAHDLSEQNIVKQLAMLGSAYKAADHHGWRVITGKHETEQGLTVAMLAFGELCESDRQQKDVIQNQRTKQIQVYSSAASTVLIRESGREPDPKDVPGVKEILFPSAKVDLFTLIQELDTLFGGVIPAQNLVQAVSLAYQVAWSSAYSTKQSITGRFTPTFTP